MKVTEESAIWNFCAGLADTIHREVEYHKPESVYVAMSLARKTELKLPDDIREKTFGGFPAPRACSPGQGTGFSQGGDASSGWKSSTKRGEPQIFKKISYQEMADRRAKGLCFNCDEMFTPGHRCKKLFFLQLAEEDWKVEDGAVT